MKVGTNETISENFSEKGKRGRPRLMQPELEKRIREEKPYTDLRTLHNEHYEARAFRILGLSPNNPPDFPFSWLSDNSKVELGLSKRRGHRKTILAELGRIADKKNLIEAATEICLRKPKTQDAIKLIRGWRLGRASDSVTLESTLRKAIENYIQKHNNVTDNDIYESLSLLEEEYLQKAMFGK
jgi:hypothetical protein